MNKKTQAELPSSTTPEYILTPEDEEVILAHAKVQAIKNYAWRLKDRGCYPGMIEDKLSKVDWDKEINRDEILEAANIARLHARWLERQRERRIREENELRGRLNRECDLDYFLNLMRTRCQAWKKEALIEDEHTSSLIRTICLFMSRDPDIEKLGFSTKKGLLIRGACGLGKTFLFKLIRENPVRPVNLVSMLEIADTVRKEGFFSVSNSGILYLDDVGSEGTVMHYGTKINWFKEFFELFYLKSARYNKLVISTNLSFDELEEKYGYRLRSRVKEVFNIVNVTGKDLRG